MAGVREWCRRCGLPFTTRIAGTCVCPTCLSREGERGPGRGAEARPGSPEKRRLTVRVAVADDDGNRAAFVYSREFPVNFTVAGIASRIRYALE